MTRLVRTDRHTTPQQRRGTIPIRRGIRAHESEWQNLLPHERYRERVLAAVFSLGDPLLAFESAALVHGLPVFAEPKDVHVFVTVAGHSYRHGDVLSHTGVDGRREVRVSGIRVTDLVDTVVDLIRVLPLAFGVAVVDAALRGGVRLTDLEDRLRTQRNPRGTARAWDALRRSAALSESVLESVSRVVIQLLGFAAPELQVEFTVEDGVRRADFLWRGAGIIGEADGASKYLDVPAAQTAARIRDERRREVQLQRLVTRIARWEWADVIVPARLERILADAGVPRVAPADPRVVAAVSNAVRTVRASRR
ncbi:hypothetical protein [Microbacterium sp. NPDC096154]|uniref:hypothetical protein n=1 Tax=Microbacterium sp. NPDC096154 TaxID=3155549 RepID=UPI003323B463